MASWELRLSTMNKKNMYYMHHGDKGDNDNKRRKKDQSLPAVCWLQNTKYKLEGKAMDEAKIEVSL